MLYQAMKDCAPTIQLICRHTATIHSLMTPYNLKCYTASARDAKPNNFADACAHGGTMFKLKRSLERQAAYSKGLMLGQKL